MSAKKTSRHYRALFISDVHLGTRGCQADLLLDFLKDNDAETIYLVGDIADGWRLKRSWYWPQLHNDVVQKILRKSRKGARVVYIPGNHDEFLRSFLGTHFGGVEVADSIVHDTADGKQYLVIHGDQFDVVIRHAKWLAFFGDTAYVTVLGINTWLNVVRRHLGFTYWSLSAWAKLKVKNAVSFIGRFEDALSDQARRQGLDGVICGHIHHAASRNINGIHYINTGDWVESCTAVAEHHDGTFEVIRWAEVTQLRAIATVPPEASVAA